MKYIFNNWIIWVVAWLGVSFVLGYWVNNILGLVYGVVFLLATWIYRYYKEYNRK